MDFKAAPTDPVADPGKEEKRPGTIQSVSTAVQFLRVLSNANEPLPLGQIAKAAGTGASTAHRYMQSLVRDGLAQQDPLSGRYDLGPLALSIGIAALKRIDPVEIAAREMKGFVETASASGGVAIWTERGPTLVRWYRSAVFSISSLGLGDILPIDNSACGLVFQAFLPEARIAEARRQQPESFRGSAPSAGQLDQVRRTRRCEMKGHLLPQISGQAVPVFDAQNEIVCAITTIADLGQSGTDETMQQLAATGHRIAAHTGSFGPEV